MKKNTDSRYAKREGIMRISYLVGIFVLLTLIGLSPASTQATDATTYEALRKFSQVMDIIEENYVSPVSQDDLIKGAIEGMLNKLDPHSTLIDKDEYKFMQEEFSGEFGGIGVQIGMREKRLTVISPIEDTPAFKAGLLAGDVIIKIDGQSALDMTLTEAVSKIRGPKGEAVVLTVVHADGGKPVDITIVRGTIPLHSVKVMELEPGYLHVRLTDFKNTTTEDMHKEIKNYQKKAALRGVVLDLRNNPGGLLSQAISVADTFLTDGLIVYTQGRDPQNRLESRAAKQATDLSCPLVVLINAGSASASEIVAGAIQDQKRGLLLGEKTFGKGSVQTVLPIHEGSAVKLTIALYYTPKGRSIQAEGIQPDILLPFEAPHEREDALFGDFREENLDKHLDNPNAVRKQLEKRGSLAGQKEDEAKKVLQHDNQLRMGLELVKSLPTIMELR